MALLQSKPSLGSPAGIITMLVGVALSVFLLTQFDFTRRLMGIPVKGEFKTE